MEAIQWTPEFSVGVEKIDEQHQGLFNLLNTLQKDISESQNRKILEKAVEKLLDYTKYHFSTEEYLLRQAHYPDYEAHKKEHDGFVSQVTNFYKNFIAEKEDLNLELITFLYNWIFNHIMKTDKNYTPFLKK